MTEAPDLVHGAWARRSVTVDDGAPFETQHVVWIQAGTCYADLRVPFHAAAEQRCFTGRSGWDGDRYRWSHHLDLESVPGVASPPADDIGDLSWEDDTLVERGMFPTTSRAVRYTEVWARLNGDGGSWLALEDDDATLVRVGDHAITVVDARDHGGRFTAVYRRRGAGGWDVVAEIGPGRRLPGPADPNPGWRVVHRSPRGIPA